MNLPNWPGASVCYSRAYALLERWAHSGHVSRVKIGRKRYQCRVSEDMTALIEALNQGNEEAIKGTLLRVSVESPVDRNRFIG